MASSLYYGEEHNCTNVDELMQHYVLPLSYSIIFVVGVVGNLTSISIYATKLRPWKSSSIIMVNLAVTDLLNVLTMPYLIYYYSSWCVWTLGDFMCRFVRLCFLMSRYGSILSLMCLAVFRYVVVVRPFLAAQVQKRRWGITVCLVIWITASIKIIPMFSIINLEEHGNRSYCVDFASATPLDKVRSYSWSLTAFGFLLPLVVVLMCYIGIVRHLTNGPYSASPSRLRTRHMTVLILVAFVVCFLPYHILRVIRIEMRSLHLRLCMAERIVHAAYILSRPLAALNTFFNLALYTLSGDSFRRAFLSVFAWECLMTKARALLQLAFGRDMLLQD